MERGEGSFIERLRTKGMIMRSTRFLVNKLLNMSEKLKQNGQHILEIGAGHGVFTKKIVERIRHLKDSVLTIVEIEPKYREQLLDIIAELGDRARLIIDSVENVPKYTNRAADVVISSLPLKNFDDTSRYEVIHSMHNLMKKGGEFLQYQYFRSNLRELEQRFLQKAQVAWVFGNLPPAFVYKLIKK